MIYYAENAFIFCLVQLLNAKLASSVLHVWQTPLWSEHPTGCERPAGSANSFWHYLLLILILGSSDILGKDELAQEEGDWEGGNRGKGDEVQRQLPPAISRSFFLFPLPGMQSAFPVCPLPSVQHQE